MIWPIWGVRREKDRRERKGEASLESRHGGGIQNPPVMTLDCCRGGIEVWTSRGKVLSGILGYGFWTVFVLMICVTVSCIFSGLELEYECFLFMDFGCLMNSVYGF